MVQPGVKTIPPVSVSALDRTLSAVDQAYNYILEGIVSGSFEPGMRIPTEWVADALGISRMPVRDALRRLEADGVVTIFANRGASIAEYSIDEVIELTEMRAVLEGLAARVALPTMGDEEIEELVHLEQRLQKTKGDLARWTSCHDDFHNYLTSLSRRPLLMQQTKRIRLMLRPYFRYFYQQSRELEVPGIEHQLIINAVKRRDAEELEKTVRTHATVNAQKVAQFARGA